MRAPVLKFRKQKRQRMIRQFEHCGAHFELRVESVHLVRPRGTAIPSELIEAARAGKIEIRDVLRSKHLAHSNAEAADPDERAAIIEHDAGMPRDWAEAFARSRKVRLPAILSLSDGRTP